MEAVGRRIAPQATVIHLMHGIPSYSVIAAARTLEAVYYFPVGAHVCVCDPGVGSSRKGLAIEVIRGDFLVGPDNGVLIPATRVLGGIRRCVQLENPRFMLLPVSPIFHGRDVFVPAAAHLVNGVSIAEFGKELAETALVAACYEEAAVVDSVFECTIIQINKFGSLHLNILHEAWDAFCPKLGVELSLSGPTWQTQVLTVNTFSDAAAGRAVILKDDYGRMEVAINLGAFVERYPVTVGDHIRLRASAR